MASLALNKVDGKASNPIDIIEQMAVANDWLHDRQSDEEIVIDVAG